MSTSTLPVSTIVSVSVSAVQPGLLVPNVNNLCIVDTEVPAQPGNLTSNVGVYKTAQQVGIDWGTNSEAYAQAVEIFNQRPNILAGGGQLVIFSMNGAGLTTLTQAINAVEGLIYVGGYLWAGYNPSNGEIASAYAVVNSLGKFIGVSSYLTSDLNGGGLFAVASSANVPAAILFLYTLGGSYAAARLAMSAVFAAQMSTNFSGQNTTLNLNVKTLQDLLPDPGITPSVLTTCQNLGVSVYASIQGVAKFVANGGPNNLFFDNVYNQLWFTNALQIGIFNALAQTSTKIPQTEAGMQILKNAVIAVCQQAVTNGYVAPGAWKGTDTFGNQASFLRNIAQLGYYVFSQPVALQSEAQRETRAAPLMQLAAKLAGAINTASLTVNIEP